jgi:hypothetical protein
VHEFERFPRSVVQKSASHTLIEWPGKHLANEPHLYCAYNQTREKFLCTHLELADLSPENLRKRLTLLTPESEKALWLAPFNGISPNDVESPIDLVFIDSNNCVLEVVESFPIAQPTSGNWPSGTALALPAQSSASSGTLAGDQLVLCSPQKMQRRFLNLRDVGTGADMSVDAPGIQNRSSHPQSTSYEFPHFRKTKVQETTWERVVQKPKAADDPVAAVPATASPAQTSIFEAKSPPPAAEVADAPRNWLFCLLAPRRRDKRKSSRQALPWVAAYFFNGGAPAPASVRNIGMSGMYVVTSERWYLGTILHVTLSDWRLPSPKRFLTVNAMAVRWGDDGVGLRFVFQKPRRGESTATNDPLLDVTPQQVKDFLQRFKAGEHPN